MVNNPSIRPYFLGGGGIGGVPLDYHDVGLRAHRGHKTVRPGIPWARTNRLARSGERQLSLPRRLCVNSVTS